MKDSTKIGIAVAAMIIAAALWNVYSEGAAHIFISRKPEEKKASDAVHEQTPADLLKNVPDHRFGPKNAPVVIKVLMAIDNSCHTASVTRFKELQQEYGDQVCVMFLSMADPEVAKLADTSKIGCEMGILINGKSAFKIEGRGLVLFQGPADMGKDYSMDDVRLVVDKIIKEKTGKPPVKKAPQQEACETCTPQPPPTSPH
jgi:hypothetical protein